MNKEELEKLAKPLNEWLRKNGKNGGAHTHIFIYSNGVEVVESKMFFAVDVSD